MGANASRPRRITMDNQDPANVIKVSGDVVQRLKGGQEQQKHPVSNSNIKSGSANILGDLQSITATPWHEPSLTSLQIRQANVNALKDNDEYWEQRICQLQNSHQEMHEVMEEEYKKAISEYPGGPDASGATNYRPPCKTSRRKVMECYKKNPNETMKCAKEVQAFARCVDLKRADIIANRG